MDELMEFLQISLEKDFIYEDDAAVDKLREAIAELASNRLDSPGRPPSDELPQRPFGMPPPPAQALKEEAGLRARMTEKERQFGVAAARRREEGEAEAAANVDEEEVSDHSLDETTSIPEAAMMNHSGHSGAERLSSSSAPMGGAGGGVSRDPRAPSAQSAPHNPSDAVDRLDDSVRMLLLQSADLNGRGGGGANSSASARQLETSSTSQRYSSSSLVMSSSVTESTRTPRNNGRATVYEESQRSATTTDRMVIKKADVVKIHVPYTPSPSGEVTVSADERNRTKVSPNRRIDS